MYKLDCNFDFDTLIGKEVQQICYSASEIVISWNYKEWIQFMGPFSINGEYYDVIFPVKTDFGLLKLIGEKVINVSTNNDRDCLFFSFEHGSRLSLIGNPQYESFIIHWDDKTIII